MKTEQVDTLVLGAGPSGLAAGYMLAKAGRKPVVLERDKVAGGLMRCLHHGGFVVDVGRKELYNRLEKVDTFWRGLLGADYRDYPHRGGILFEGRIIDSSPAFQGFRRGMPWGMFLGCSAGFLLGTLPLRVPPGGGGIQYLLPNDVPLRQHAADGERQRRASRLVRRAGRRKCEEALGCYGFRRTAAHGCGSTAM